MLVGKINISSRNVFAVTDSGCFEYFVTKTSKMIL